jgi:ABC-type multidrug transport system ATPase subunit
MVQAFAEEVLELVELKQMENALVGLPGITGLSTEQRKRLTIAVELVANPSIIFMDEPTSGLDARAAAIVMRTVRNTVNTGRTVVCTIHQPSIDIFEAFDEVSSLSEKNSVKKYAYITLTLRLNLLRRLILNAASVVEARRSGHLCRGVGSQLQEAGRVF